MCVPLPIALIVASAFAKAGGQYVEGKAAYTQAKYEQAAAVTNQHLAEDQARNEIDVTKREAARRYRQAGQLEGQQTAAMAANGIDLAFGSALDVQKDSKMIAAEDVGSIYDQGFQNTQGHLVAAYNQRLRGLAAQSTAKAAGISTAFGIASTVLGAASQLKGK